MIVKVGALGGSASLVLFSVCLGCGSVDDAPRSQRIEFDDFFILESRHSISQSMMDPVASATDIAVSRGTYLVLDGMQSKVRQLTPDGRVVGTFGRAGSGPGELRNPLAIASFRDGGFVILNRTGSQAVFFDSGGAQIDSWPTGIPLATSVRVLDSATVVIFGERISSSRDAGKGPIAHVFDRTSGVLRQQAGTAVLEHALESRMRTAKGAVAGSTVFVGFTTSNHVLAIDLETEPPSVNRITVAPGLYEPWDWDGAEGAQNPQTWMRDQTWLQRVMLESDSLLIVTFGIPHETERRFRFEYAFNFVRAGITYVTEPVDAELFEVGNGEFVALDIQTAGADLLRYRLSVESIAGG